jgi:hypothetical protein
VRFPLPFVRRKPPPRHALPDEAPLAPTPKRRDGSTIGVILVLVLTSGFVAGTTATFTGTTTNAGNEFAAAALSVPAALTAEPKGNNVQLLWTNASGADVLNAGYRVSWVDWQAAPQPVATTCGVASPSWTKIGVAQSGVTGVLDAASTHTNFTDGRTVCYQVQTSYPCCSGGVEGTNAWVSQPSGSQTNPGAVANVGMTLVNFVSGNVLTAGTVATGDWFEFTFNQPVDMTATATITNSQFLCTDSASGAIWVGLSGTGVATLCPETAGTAAQKDTTFSGFRLVKTSGTGGINLNSRWAITVTTPSCVGGSPLGCFIIRVTLLSIKKGSPPTLSGTYKVEPSTNASFIRSSVGTVKICNHSTTTSTIAGLLLGTYSGDPTNGKCIYTGYAFLGKI